MRSRTLVLAITTALLVGAGPAQAHGGHHPQAPQAARGGRPASEHQRLPRQPRTSGHDHAAGRRADPRRRGRVPGHAHQHLRAQNRNTLVVSAGDNIGASPLVSGLFHDEPTIEAFNAMGVDISSVGNHEFDEGSAELLRMQDGGCHPVDGCQDGDGFAGADFDYLAANVVDDDTGPHPLPPLRDPPRRRREGRLHRRRAQGHADDRHPVGRRGTHVRRRGRRDQQVHGQAQEEGRARDRRAHAPGRHRRPRSGQRLHQPDRPAGRHHRALQQGGRPLPHRPHAPGLQLRDRRQARDQRVVVRARADRRQPAHRPAHRPGRLGVGRQPDRHAGRGQGSGPDDDPQQVHHDLGADRQPPDRRLDGAAHPRSERGRRVGARRHHRRLPARGHRAAASATPWSRS